MKQPASNLRMTIQFFIAGIAVILFSIASCKRIEQELQVKIETGSVTALSYSYCVIEGKVVDIGDGNITQHGFCYDLSETPSIINKNTQLGVRTSAGAFSDSLLNLESGTTYYVRAYALASDEIYYGAQTSFTTLSPTSPKVVIASVSEVKNDTVEVISSVTDDGGSAVNSRGVCWSLEEDPTVLDGFTMDGEGMGSFNSYITGLMSDTVYYIRAYASSSVATSYSTQHQVSTPPGGSVKVTTNPVSGITMTGAVSGGHITDDGGLEIIARGVCWSSTQHPTVSDQKTIDGTGTGSFISTVTGLLPGTTYYIRAYAITSTGVYYGEELDFTTTSQSASLPTISTAAVTGISTTTAMCGGNITHDGGSAVIAHGVCWSTSQEPSLTDNISVDGSGTGVFTSSLTDLECNTSYYIRAYATNSAGTAYGSQASFTTSQCSANLPVVTTETISSITGTTAQGGGNVTDDGGDMVATRGVCWSLTPNPTTSDSKTTDGSGTGVFTSAISGLSCNTTYFVRAYATNSYGTAYGAQVTFITNQCIYDPPTVTSTPISNITETSALGGGIVTSDGGSNVTARGVCWSTSENPTLSDNITTDGNGTGSYTSDITGLICGTTYYLRAYATNSAGTTYGDQLSFSTISCQTMATITTNSVSNITETSAHCGGNVTSDGGSNVTARGVCWSTDENPTISDSKTTDGGGTGSFASEITGLSRSTTYYVRAYATNSEGTSYGNQESFTTKAYYPTVSTSSISSITLNSAQGGGNVTSDGGSTVTAKGVCWSTSENPTVSDSKTVDGTGIGSYTSTISGLSCGTTYYVRAYAINAEGTAYGSQRSFSTSSCPVPPSLTTSSVSSITETTAQSGGNVTSDGGASVIARGVCWSIYQNPTTSNSHTTDGSGTGSFSSSITGLTCGTIYFTRAYATNSAGTSYGNHLTFVTDNCVVLPTVTTTSVSNVYSESAQSGGNVTSDGGGTILARGVCWSTSTNPTISDSHTTDGYGTGSYTSNISGLSQGTTYYVRAYATNSAGTSYGGQLSFHTMIL